MKQERSAKGTILANIRNALLRETPQPYPAADATEQMYVKEEEDLDILFAKNFTSLQGNFVFCENDQELVQNLDVLAEQKQWNHLFCWDKPLQDLFINNNFKKCRIGKDLEKADAGITYCEALVARTGSALITSGQSSGRSLPIFPPVHIIVAYTDQLVYDIQQALQLVKNKYETLPSMINLATGPSRTADIEKTLVLGAHGPKEVYLFLIER